MTPAPGPAPACRHVIVTGGGSAATAATAELLSRGITDVRVLNDAPANSTFDDGTDTWRLHTAAGEVLYGRVVIAAHRPPFDPWIPKFAGRNDFRGVSFHAAHWDADFVPDGKRVAIVGADSGAAQHIGRLIESAASVAVFAHAPRRIVAELPSATTRARRWLRGRVRPDARSERARPALVGSSIAGITASGIRTADGVDHGADAIIYATGYAVDDRIPDETLVGTGGLTIRRAWTDGMEPYMGVAVHGFPNYFFIIGPDVGAQARYVADCVRLMKDAAGTRIEVRRSSQQLFNERVRSQPPPAHRVAGIVKAFDISTGGGEVRETYDGAATLTISGINHPVRARLAGRLDPIDGKYHWQGTISMSSSQPLPDEVFQQSRTATLTVGERDAPLRIVEKTPWGTHSVAGVGAPPYASQ